MPQMPSPQQDATLTMLSWPTRTLTHNHCDMNSKHASATTGL